MIEIALQVFDVAVQRITADVPVGAGPTSVAVSPDGRFAYTSGGTTRSHVQIVDTSTNTAAADVDAGGEVISIFIRGDAMMVGIDGGVALLDAATGQSRGTIAVKGYLGAVSPDGRTAYLFTDRAGQFVEVDLPGRRVESTFQLDALVNPAGFSADGSSVYFSAAGPSIAVVDAATRRVTRTISTPVDVGVTAVSPNGELVYFRGPESVVAVRVA